MNIDTYPVEQIDVGDRLRLTNPDRVAEIALSIEERGLLQPVGLSPEIDGRRRLVFGAHRLAAFKSSQGQRGAIPFVERAGSADELRLMEIDENLYRHELTAADEADFLTERGRIFERLHGKARPGRKAAGNSAKLTQLDMFAELEARFGLKKRGVQRALQRRRDISDEAWAELRGTPLADNGVGLDALARCFRGWQLQAVRAVYVDNSADTIQAAIAKLTGGPSAEPVSMLDRLVKRWPKLTEAEQREIKAWVGKATVG